MAALVLVLGLGPTCLAQPASPRQPTPSLETPTSPQRQQQHQRAARALCSHLRDKPLPRSLSSIPWGPPLQPARRPQTRPSRPQPSLVKLSSQLVRQNQNLLVCLGPPRNQQLEEPSLAEPAQHHLHSLLLLLLQAHQQQLFLVVHLPQHLPRNLAACLVVALVHLLPTCLVVLLVHLHPSPLNLLLLPVLLSLIANLLRRRRPHQQLLRQLLEVFSLASALLPPPARLRLPSLPCSPPRPLLPPPQRLQQLLLRLRASLFSEYLLPRLLLRRRRRLPRVPSLEAQQGLLPPPPHQPRLLPLLRRTFLVQSPLRPPLQQRLPLAQLLPPPPLLPAQTRRLLSLKTPPRQPPTCPPPRWVRLPRCPV